MEGNACSAILLGYLNSEESVLMPIGYQFGCIWMDVRYQDGDWWDLTVYKGSHHQCSHNVNPWAEDSRAEYNQEHIDHRIQRVCELWPKQAARIDRYLLPWRKPVRKLGRLRLVAREGKAYQTDQYRYGDADQIFDFVRAFGIDKASRSVEIGP
jgi:hypothetical protein